MTTFKRPSEFARPAKYFQQEITLAPEESKQARLKAWLKEKLASPHYCARHPRTRLAFGPADKSGIGPVCAKGPHPVDLAQERPGAFRLYAQLHCPACQCAYARCPLEFHTASFETFHTSTPEQAGAVTCCRSFVAQVNQRGCGFALLMGLSGSGKTRLACNILRELEDPDVLYARQGELTLALRTNGGPKEIPLTSQPAHVDPSFDKDDPAEETGDDSPSTPLEILQKVRFLVLDELGANPLASRERLFLDEILKHRYDHRKPTVLVSNLPLDQLKEFLGSALADRIQHASGNGKFILQFSGSSFRRNSGENYLAGLSERLA